MSLTDDIIEAARREGFAIIIGQPARFSEWGVEYLLFGNATERVDGAEPVQRTPEQMLDKWNARLKNERRARGHDVIVWRTMPELTTHENGRRHLYFRCYFTSLARLSETPMIVATRPVDPAAHEART